MQARQDTVRCRWKSAGSREKVRARARIKRNGKKKVRAKERARKNPRARSARDGATTPEHGVTKLQTVGMRKEKQMHQVQGKAGTASSSSLQSTLSATDVSTKEIGLIESVCEDAELIWIFVVTDAAAINQLYMDLVVDSGAHVQSQELCHSRDSGSTAGMLARFGSSISKWQDVQISGNARGCVQRDGSARQSVHCGNPFCCL